MLPIVLSTNHAKKEKKVSVYEGGLVILIQFQLESLRRFVKVFMKG